ncbi:MAG TPA: hypothetical protein VNE41_02600 [Chitinophagaceae bacterium]|nr:hypothetical protein [Chitinophagaceae bacterium]
MAIFHRNAYWFTLLAALLSLFFFLELRSGYLNLHQTYFLFEGFRISGDRITQIAGLALLGFILQTVLYFSLKYRIRSTFLVPAHTCMSVLLLLVLLLCHPFTHPVLMFNLLAFLTLTQLLFVFALIIVLRDMVKTKSR